MAALLYLGAGLGLFLYGKLGGRREKEEPLTRKELPYTLGMILLDIAAPILLMLGFVAYGLSINFYIKAQKDLGAAKTSAYYSIAPFLGVTFGMLLLGERPAFQFYIGLLIMVLATVLMIKDTIRLQHSHEHSHVHTHEHRHGELIHTHEHEHIHSHIHVHGEDESTHRHSHEDIPEHEHEHSEVKY